MSFFKTCSVCGFGYAGPLCPTCAETSSKTALASPSLPQPLPIGQTFRGFEVLEILGRGGMGIVYKARQPSLDRFVALKILPPEKATLPGFGERFGREARALAALSHPNIVTVYDSGQEGPLYFFAMEYVDGLSLRNRIAQGKLAWEEILPIARQVCEALAYAHGEGIVHRDIKPDNILIDRKGRVKIADFGLAKIVANELLFLTGSGVALGTAAYVAPEQVENSREVDHRADLYSTGVVLYEMLTGQLPLGQFDPPSKITSTHPKLDAVVLRALSKRPERRHSSAAELRDDLERATGDAPPVIPVAPKRRSKGWIAALLAPLFVAGAFFAWQGFQKSPLPPPPTDPPERILASLLPDAAAVDRENWAKLQANVSWDEIDNQSLTALLWRQRPPLDLLYLVHPAREAIPSIVRPERISVLQPEYLQSVSFDETTGCGVCLFESTTYSGAVRFVAARQEGRWVITEFNCGVTNERTVRQPDGRWKAAATKADDLLAYVEIQALSGHSQGVTSMALSPDGGMLAVGSGDGTIHFWSPGQGKRRGPPLVLRKGTAALAFHPKEPQLAVGGADRTVRLLDPASRSVLHVLEPHSDAVTSLAYSPDGRRIAAGCMGGTIKIWDCAKGKGAGTWSGHPPEVKSLAFSPDGTLLASSSTDSYVRLWNWVEGKKVVSLEGHNWGVPCVAFSPDGKMLASVGDDNVWKLWDVAAGRELRGAAVPGVPFRTVAFRPDGKVLAIGSDDGKIRLWSTETAREVKQLAGHTGLVRTILFGPEGRILISGGQDGIVKVWAVKK